LYKLRTFSGVLAFDAAARHGSLTLAAKELGRTQSAVSQQVKALEQQLGLSLFVRKPREISLTSAGRTLAKSVRASIEEVEATVTELSRTSDPHILRLTTYQSFSIHWLIPRLPSFSLKHPEIDVRIDAADQKYDLRTEDIDLAIRVGTPPVRATALLPETFLPLYAPSIAGGKPIEITDALQHRLLVHLSAKLWNEWFKLNGLDVQHPEIATGYSHSGLLVQAAIAGGGIALAPPVIAADSVYSGRLNYISGKPLLTGYEYYIESAEKNPPEKVRLFTEWVQGEAADMRKKHPDWFA